MALLKNPENGLGPEVLMDVDGAHERHCSALSIKLVKISEFAIGLRFG